MDLTCLLFVWYEKNKRDLPWRKTSDPYFIWLSEIILQQTRVNQGLSYYYKFTELFPTVNHLAEASEHEVLKAWQGLGYYSRARNLHLTAKYISHNLKAEFPADFEALLKLKGIGEYTAAAIASFAFNMPYPVIDGNVQRVISRLFGIEEEITSSFGKMEIKESLNKIFPKKTPAQFNQAIMEFGALQCVPKNPDCGNCPLSQSCIAFSKNIVSDLPKKKSKKKPVDRYLNYFHITDGENLLLEKRTTDGIWKNLYHFPVIETSSVAEPEEIFATSEWKNLTCGKRFVLDKVSPAIKHQLSHQTIYAVFYKIGMPSSFFKNHKISVKLDSVEKYPVPRLMEKYFASQD